MRFNILLVAFLTIITFTLTNTSTANAQDISNEITASVDGDFFADMETTTNGHEGHNHEAPNTDPNNNNATAPAVVLQSNLTCPKCNHKSAETMPANSCKYFHKCGNCQETIKAAEGKCCVFCSYGDTICPPTQVHNHKQGK